MNITADIDIKKPRLTIHKKGAPGADIALQDYEKRFTMLSVEDRRTCIQFRPDALLLYNQSGRGDRDLIKEKKQLTDARRKKYTGDLCAGAQKNLVRGFDNLLFVTQRKPVYNRYLRKNVQFQLGMITLTMPTDRKLSSKEMNKRLLKRFLQKIENYCEVHQGKKLLYLWKLELQERGQLHWHIIVNRFIPYELLNRWWSYLLQDTGLTFDFYNKFGTHVVKSAVRVESVKMNTATDMRNYILKRYLKKRADKAVTKKMEQVRIEGAQGLIDFEQTKKQLNDLREICSLIDGSVWGCSDPLKEKYPSIEMDFATYMRFKNYYNLFPVDFVHFEFCMFIRDDKKKPPDILISPKFKALIRAQKDIILLGGNNILKNLN